MSVIIQYSSVPPDEHNHTSDSITINVPTFEELHETYREYVRRRICNLLRYRPDLIEDAIQDTWIKVWRSLPQINSTQNLKGWLWLVATNTVRDTMRHMKSYQPHYPSLEAAFERFDIPPDEYRNALVPDPHDYIPALLERQARRQHIYTKLSAKDKKTFAAYVANEPVRKQDLYSARRNFSDRYKRAVAREQEVA